MSIHVMKTDFVMKTGNEGVAKDTNSNTLKCASTEQNTGTP